MKIKEQSQRHMIIGATFAERLGVIISWLILTLIPFFVLISDYLWAIAFIIVGVIGITLEFLNPNEVIIDKLTQSIMIREKLLWLFHRQRDILFSSVNTVEIAYKRILSPEQGKGFWQDAWKVSLNTGGGKVGIDHSEAKEEVLYLAEQISNFIGKDLVDNSRKPQKPVKPRPPERYFYMDRDRLPPNLKR